MSGPVPPEAVEAAYQAWIESLPRVGELLPGQSDLRAHITRVVEAAAPHIASAAVIAADRQHGQPETCTRCGKPIAKVHLALVPDGTAACNPAFGLGRFLTRNPRDVTCARCQRTRPFADLLPDGTS